MQIYSKNKKNCFFHISWPIFILFVLSDRARWGLQDLYTKFRNSLIMQIYANLFKITNKITKNASHSFLNRFWFSLLYLVSSGILRVLGKKYIKRLLTVNTIVLYEAPKANLKVMYPWPLRSLLSQLICYSLYHLSSRSKIFNDRCMSLKVDFWSHFSASTYFTLILYLHI